MSFLNLLDEHSFYGEWWLPKKPNIKFKGKLTYKPENGLFLEIYIKDPKELLPVNFNTSPFEEPIILGCSNEGKVITLYNFSSINISIGDNLLSNSYKVEFAFLGKHFESINEVKFINLYTSYTNLPAFIGKTGIKLDTIFGFSYNLYDLSIKLCDYEDFNIDFSFKPTQSFSLKPYYREITLKEEIDLNIKFLEPKLFINKDAINTSCFDIIESLRLFFSLVLRTPSYPIYVKGKCEDNYVDVLFYTPYMPHKSQISLSLFPLFEYKDVSSNFCEILQKWFKNSKSLKSTYDFYGGFLFNSYMYLEYQFCVLIFALESYYRERFESKYIPPEEYNTVKERIWNFISSINNINNSLKNHLKSLLDFGNEYSLRKKLKEIFKSYNFIAEVLFNVNEITTFIDEVVRLRNSIAHGIKHKESNKRMKNLIKSLRIILEGCFLVELGLEPSNIKEILKKIVERDSIF